MDTLYSVQVIAHDTHETYSDTVIKDTWASGRVTYAVYRNFSEYFTQKLNLADDTQVPPFCTPVDGKVVINTA